MPQKSPTERIVRDGWLPTKAGAKGNGYQSKQLVGGAHFKAPTGYGLGTKV